MLTRGRIYDVVANVMDCDVRVSEFELQTPYYVQFQTYTLWKSMNPLIPKLWVK